jgi:RNA polymerase sigma-70 factor, ECF subfamily
MFSRRRPAQPSGLKKGADHSVPAFDLASPRSEKAVDRVRNGRKQRVVRPPFFASFTNERAQPSDRVRVQLDMEGVAALERDAQLMLRVREGDDSSFALLLNQHRRPVVHFLFRMVQNRAISEELAQEVFLRVYRSRGSYEPTAKFTTWLFRIATHVALNWIRDRKNERGHESLEEEAIEGVGRQIPDLRPTVEHRMVSDARLDEVRRAIDALPAKQRAAVVMHKYHELDYDRISRALGISESALKSLLFRAYETLRERLSHLA